VGAGGEGGDGVDHLRQQLQRQVVAGTLEHDQLGAGDELGGALAPRWSDERVDVAVDDDGRHIELGQPTPEAMAILLRPTATSRDEAIAASVEASKAIGSPEHFDPTSAKKRAEEAYDRAFFPAGVARQLLAIVASGSRADGLAQLDVPTVVIHGDVDPLVTPSGGQRTAELIPGAELVMLEGAGHDLPLQLLPQVVDAVTALAARAQA